MSVRSTGNVGIGTTTPTARMHVTSNSYPETQEVLARFTGGIADYQDNRYVLIENTFTGAGYYSPALVFKTNANANNQKSFGSIVLSSAGDLSFQTKAAGSDVAIGTDLGTTQRMVIESGGNVGIGAHSPLAKSHIKDTGWSSGAPYGTVQLIEGNNVNDNNWGHLVITDSSTANGNGGSIRFATGAGGTSTLNPFSGVSGISEGTSWGGLGFFTRPQSGTATERMSIDSAGTVDIANDLLTNNAKLKAIAASNSDTAADVFVYDTRKDSDGGAWRKRTQNTSWYNETLNTSTRGARKEFPSVAVIVAESNQVTIYDGDDPDMPMWMVFNVANNTWLKHSGSGGCKAVVARDGIMVTGGDIRGSIVRFVADDGNVFEAGYNYEHDGIVTRNTSGVGPATGPIRIVNNSVNDVAMTVLPNAPIDADTGLPVPTIAVGTLGGTSVITDSGNVYDISGFSPTTSIEFYGSKLAFSTEVSSTAYITVGSSTLSSDISVQNWRDYKGEYNSSGTQGIEVLKDMADHLAYGNAIYSAGVTGLTAIDHNDSDATLSMGAIIGSDYNTGWMVGDIKLATLSDTSTTNAVGTDLLGGIGNFTDGGAWTVPSGWSLSSNIATGSAVTAYLLPVSNGILTAGKRYAVTVTQSSYTSGTVYMYVGVGAPSGIYYVNLPSTTGTFTFILTAYNSDFGIYGANYTGVIDNVTISLAEEDRRVELGGLQVFGTVTKTAVATGADLVGYSGFSASNYLKQPYSSDLDFGTGDFSITCWFKLDSNTGNSRILYRQQDSSNRWAFYSNAGNLWFYQTDGTATYAQSSTTHSLGVWNHVVVRRSSNGTDFVLNGKVLSNTASYPGTTSRDASFTGVLYMGHDPNGGTSDHFNGDLALIRISSTIPTEEQITKMYNDEKHLFQPNAKATLYGTSDAVTALAYDDDTELLHAGTSAGRSVFQGLRRVDNTTDAVGAAISASNGFIVED